MKYNKQRKSNILLIFAILFVGVMILFAYSIDKAKKQEQVKKYPEMTPEQARMDLLMTIYRNNPQLAIDEIKYEMGILKLLNIEVQVK